MISLSIFLAAAVELTTLFMVWCCLAGEDANDPDMWADARKVFVIGSLLAAGVASFHYT
jgi:hypothetical protein